MGLARMGAAIVLALSLTSAARAADLYSTSFEFAQGFTTGLLLDDGFRTTANPGQGGWYGEDLASQAIQTSNANISTDYAHTGTQSLRLGNEVEDVPPAGSHNTYKLYSHDFPAVSSGMLTTEVWYFLENVDTTSSADTNVVLMIFGNRDEKLVLNGVSSSFGGNPTLLSPDNLVVATATSTGFAVDYTGIAGAGAWKGLKIGMNMDAKMWTIQANLEDGLGWVEILSDEPWDTNLIPSSIATFSVYQLSPGQGTSSFNNPNFGAYVDDISITGVAGFDFDGDGDCDAADIDVLLANLTGSDVYNEVYDLDGDFDADHNDLIKFVREIKESEFGDWNLDGSVDLADFNLWLDSDGSGGWAEGDGNGDESNDLADFNMWLGESPPTTAPQAFLSPEPATLLLFGAAALLALRRTKKLKQNGNQLL